MALASAGALSFGAVTYATLNPSSPSFVCVAVPVAAVGMLQHDVA